jgi:hypothetical protein
MERMKRRLEDQEYQEDQKYQEGQENQDVTMSKSNK